LSPAGDRVLTLSERGKAQVWDAATGREIAALHGQVSVTPALDAIEVLAQDPDPAVVTDAAARERIKATGKAWKIRHTASGIVMLLVPPGEFLMGSPETEENRGEDECQHRRAIGRAFYLSQTQVSKAQWRSIMRTAPGLFALDALPVESVSWFDCKRFCELSGLRLPHEAEWEYACRAGTTTAYSFGDRITKEQVCFKSEKPVACGSLPANAWGFHEMHGNFSEWVEDAYAKHPKEADGQEAVAGGDSADRVLRGGSWCHSTSSVRSSYRYKSTPGHAYGFIGFRVARNPL
jgi:formylglycine-generating enzyme required for sulfatase activity